MLNAAAQNSWLRAHAVPLKGAPALAHMLQYFDLFWQQFAAVGSLTLSSAFAALMLFNLMKPRDQAPAPRRAP